MAKSGHKLAIDRGELIDAMVTAPDLGVRFFLDTATGEIVTRLRDDRALDAEDAAEPEDRLARCARIPTIESRLEYRLMERFCEAIDEEDIRDKVRLALQGRGAFARFREVVFAYDDLREQWLTMRQAALLKEATEWLETLGIEPEFGAPTPAQAPAESEAKAPPLRPNLMHVLLLGAPDGKTELIGGQVVRNIRASTPSQARVLFKALVRDLVESRGLAWRKRFVEARTSFDLEDVTIALHDLVIEVRVRVPRAIWDVFST